MSAVTLGGSFAPAHTQDHMVGSTHCLCTHGSPGFSGEPATIVYRSPCYMANLARLTPAVMGFHKVASCIGSEL